jgi:hypothetical protein
MNLATSGTFLSLSFSLSLFLSLSLSFSLCLTDFAASNGAESTGQLWGPGLITGTAQRSSAEGRLSAVKVLSGVHVWELIGRAMVLKTLKSVSSADCGVAAVIARSAGVGANHKMLCA